VPRDISLSPGIGRIAKAMRLPGDIHISGDTLHLRLDPATAARRSRAIAGLCHELTATQTRYPGTDLKIEYSVATTPHKRSHYVGSPEATDQPGRAVSLRVFDHGVAGAGAVDGDQQVAPPLRRDGRRSPRR